MWNLQLPYLQLIFKRPIIMLKFYVFPKGFRNWIIFIALSRNIIGVTSPHALYEFVVKVDPGFAMDKTPEYSISLTVLNGREVHNMSSRVLSTSKLSRWRNYSKTRTEVSVVMLVFDKSYRRGATLEQDST